MSKKEQEENILTQPALTVPSKGNGFAIGEWPEEKWWEVFNSEELSTLIEAALEKNPTILAVKERIKLAEQEAIIARSKLFPFLYFNGADQYTYLSKNGLYHSLNPSLSQNANLIDLGLSFTYEFDFWSKYRNLTRSAYVKAAAKIAESKEVELIISSSLASAYFSLRTNLQKKILYEQLASVRKKFAKLQSLLNKKALLSKIPLTHSEESYLAAKKMVSQIDQEVITNKHLINILGGLGPDHTLAIDETCTTFCYTIEIPDTLNFELVARRPDVMAATLRAKALAFEVGAAISDFYPNINLTALLGFESLVASKLFNIATGGTVGVTPAFSLPIFTAGAIRANVRGKKALYNQAVFEYNDLLLKSTQEIADTLTLLKSLFQKRADQSLIVDQAELRLKLISKNFTSGLDDLLQVYQSEEELILKNLENIDLIYAQYLSSIKLIKALGGGYNHE